MIRGRVALLDRAALGLDVTIFAHVKLSTQGRDAIAAFAEAIRERPEVLDCYTTMGEWDFMLRVVTQRHQGLRGVLPRPPVEAAERAVDQFLGRRSR